MEIEAKFRVPNRKTLRRLQALENLCGYALGAPVVRDVHDAYLDTADRRILAAGYSCRRRSSPQGILITLKALTSSAATGVHRREEWECTLSGDAPLADWPPGPVRERLQQWIGDAPLATMVELRQTRHVRSVMEGERTVAELSLDEVAFRGGKKRRTFLGLEIELRESGNENDLATCAACLRSDWRLTPDGRSKFERALASLGGPAYRTLLEPNERATLLRLATREGRYGRRARALLAVDEGMAVTEAAAHAPLSARRIKYWLRLLPLKRLDIFPQRVRDAHAEHRAGHSDPLAATSAERPAQTAPTPVQLPDAPGITLDDSMAEAARKTLYFQLQRMLYHEQGARQGEDAEELHDMRVATRRMRAALRVFGDHIDQKGMAPFAKGLRRAGRTLGAVRDLDVLREKMQVYLDTLPSERKTELDPLLAAWQVQHERARQELLAYLDSSRYARFKQRFSAFLQPTGAASAPHTLGGTAPLPPLTDDGDLIPHLVRHVAPVIVHERLASVRAHGEWVAAPDTPLTRFHRLRIASKELRYALEFLQEVLGTESKAVISTMKGLQDHLGNLQDAVVACNLLRDFLTWGTWGHEEQAEVTWPSSPVVAPGVATYLAARQTEIQTLVQAFPPVWAQVVSPAFQKQLEAALRPLW